MMTPLSNMSVLSRTALVAMCATAAAMAQQAQPAAAPAQAAAGQVAGVLEYGSPQAYQQAVIKAVRERNWQLAIAQANKCIELYGERVQQLAIGDKFGWFYYQRGVCQGVLNDYDGAIESFDICYTKFPGDDNEFNKRALFSKGEALFLKGDYDASLETLNKFLRERRTNGNFPDARVNVGQVVSYRAQCYFLGSKPDFAKGMDDLTTCLRNRYSGQGVSDKNIVEAAVNMVKAAFKQDKVREAVDFLRQNPSLLNIGADRLAPYSPLVINTALDGWRLYNSSLEAGDNAKADLYLQIVTILTALVPDTSDVESSIKPMLAKMSNLGVGSVPYMGITYHKDIFNGALKIFEKQEEPIEGFAFQVMSGAQLTMGLPRLANASFQLMEDRYPMMKQREENLFRLILTSWQLNDFERGLKYIEVFNKAYPESQHRGTLDTLSIENLLKQQRYDECLVQARKLQDLYKNDPQNQFYILAKYCEAASLFQLKRYTEAIPKLVDFTKTYNESTYFKQALYFLGSSYVSTRDWNNAIRTMGNFIKEFPSRQDPMLPAAYYERAFSYSQRNDQNDDNLCLKDCQFIIDNFADNSIYPMALIMMGNIYSSDDTDQADAKLKLANECYEKAYHRAKELGNNAVASEAVYFLMTNYALEGNPEGVAKAQEYYDLFWKECDTPDKKNAYALRMGVEGMKLHNGGGPEFDAAAKKLRELIVREGRRDALDPAVEQAINSYTDLYFEAMKVMGKPLTQDQAKEHFYNFPGVTNEDTGLRTLLRTALIGVYQDMIAAAKPEETELKANLEGAVNVFFQELEHDFKPADLSTFTLLKLGSHLSRSSQPLRSLAYFDEIIKRDKDYVSEARFNKAIALGLSNEPANIDEGIALMTRELENERNKPYPDNAAMEEAQYYLTKFQFDKKDYDQALKQAQIYLDNKAFSKNRLRVMFIQGEAYESKGDDENALISFINLADGFKGRITWSAPATKKVMELFWKRNKPKEPGVENLLKSSDRHRAWKIGADYIRVTGPNFQKMSIAERNLWREVEDLTKQYAGQVIEEEKQIQERKAALKAAGGR